jgi:hypothetical protein
VTGICLREWPANAEWRKAMYEGQILISNSVFQGNGSYVKIEMACAVLFPFLVHLQHWSSDDCCSRKVRTCSVESTTHHAFQLEQYRNRQPQIMTYIQHRKQSSWTLQGQDLNDLRLVYLITARSQFEWHEASGQRLVHNVIVLFYFTFAHPSVDAYEKPTIYRSRNRRRSIKSHQPSLPI